MKDGYLLTPVRGTILPGITRDTIFKLPGYGELRAIPCNINPAPLLESDEVFLCGTAYEILPVSEINNKSISNGTPGSVTMLLQQQYHKAIHRELPERR